MAPDGRLMAVPLTVSGTVLEPGTPTQLFKILPPDNMATPPFTANGDLTKKVTVEARGEVAQLAETVNTMVNTLSSFADEVTRVAREVGTEAGWAVRRTFPGFRVPGRTSPTR